MKKNHKTTWFDKKTFVVTGGSSGIGFAITKLLASEGGKVVAISHNPDEFPIAQSQLDPDQNEIEFVKCNITSSTDRENLKNKLSEMEINLTGIINAAGITTFGPFFDTTIESIQENLDVNFTGTILFIRDLFPLILKNESIDTKYIGFISSTSAKAPMALIGGYPATKAGVEMFLRTLDLELPKYVKILTIRAGPVKTNFYSNSISGSGFNIQKLLIYGERMFTTPEKVAFAYVKAIIAKKSGFMYVNFGTRIMMYLMKGKVVGRLMLKVMKRLNERII